MATISIPNNEKNIHSLFHVSSIKLFNKLTESDNSIFSRRFHQINYVGRSEEIRFLGDGFKDK